MSAAPNTNQPNHLCCPLQNGVDAAADARLCGDGVAGEILEVERRAAVGLDEGVAHERVSWVPNFSFHDSMAARSSMHRSAKLPAHNMRQITVFLYIKNPGLPILAFSEDARVYRYCSPSQNTRYLCREMFIASKGRPTQLFISRTTKLQPTGSALHVFPL